jgi:hypothetical protein
MFYRESEKTSVIQKNINISVSRISALDVIPREQEVNETRLFEPPDLLRINVR